MARASLRIGFFIVILFPLAACLQEKTPSSAAEREATAKVEPAPDKPASPLAEVPTTPSADSAKTETKTVKARPVRDDREPGTSAPPADPVKNTQASPPLSDPKPAVQMTREPSEIPVPQPVQIPEPGQMPSATPTQTAAAHTATDKGGTELPTPAVVPGESRKPSSGIVAVAPTKPGLTPIGTGKCKLCHKVQYESWSKSAHAQRTPPLDCEACHGPGSEYSTLAVMKDPKRARQSGLVVPDRSFCAESCHGERWRDEMLSRAHLHKTG